MGVLNDNTRHGTSGAGAYEIDRSLRFNGADNAYLSFTPGSAGNQTTWTYSVWVKRSALSSADYDIFGNNANYNDYLFFNATTDNFEYYVSNAAGYSGPHNTNAIYRDTAAWYHIVWTRDTNNGTDADRSRIYVNGVRQTMSAQPSISSGFEGHINAASEHRIGNLQDSFDYEGYMTEINFIDGQALDASSFGETDSITGAWVPKKYAGSYGSQGYYLNFSDNSNNTAATLGKDSSGNGNNWTPNNFAVTGTEGNDSLLDTPTNNYCTFNTLCGGSTTFTQGALNTSMAAVNGCAVSNFAFDSGKWYAEFVFTSIAGYAVIGIAAPYSKGWNTSQEGSANNVCYANNSGTIMDLGSWTHASGTLSGHTFTTSDVIGLALNMDDKELTVYKNNTNTGTITFTHPGYAVSFMMGMSHGSSAGAGYANFGQRPFNTTSTEPPTGYKAPCAANLPAPTIKKSTNHFNTVLYEGTGSKIDYVSVGFQPDLTWIKNRDDTDQHVLQDSARGNFVLYPNVAAVLFELSEKLR